MEHNEIIKEIYSYFLYLQSREQENEEFIEYAQKYDLDLLHEIEFEDFDNEYGLELLYKIKENRKNRRIAKDENLIIKPIVDLLNRYPMFFNEFGQINNSIQNKYKNLGNRVYIAKTLADLKCTNRTNMGEALVKAIKEIKGD
jgi:hypothetical protein